MSDIPAVRAAINNVNRVIDQATDQNEITRKTLEDAANKLKHVIGESAQAKAEELITRLFAVAARFPDMDKELEDIKKEATAFGKAL
jgi:SMC interacting uncharacterized protein involved in chromosome segregation